MSDVIQIEADQQSDSLLSPLPIQRVELIVIPGATGPLPVRSPSGPPITTGVPPITVRGRAYSRAQVAAGTGIHITTISKYFSATRYPSIRSAIKLAAFFKVTMEELTMRILPRKEIRYVDVIPG